MKTVGWVGLGRIGAPMARRVQDAGYTLVVWARRSDQAAGLIDRGATWADDAATLARGCDAVVTVVGGPDDVQALHAVLMPAARAGTLFVDCSTAAPATAHAAAHRAQAHGHSVVEAPVTGGVAGAEGGTLTCFAAGSDDAVERARPLLSAFAQRIVPCGSAGGGYRTKLVNQTLMAGVLMGLADGARLARGAGLDAGFLHSALGTGTGSSRLFESYLARMMSGGGAVGFTLGLLLKDLMLARAEAASLGLAAPLLDAAMAATAAAIEREGADAGVQTLAG